MIKKTVSKIALCLYVLQGQFHRKNFRWFLTFFSPFYWVIQKTLFLLDLKKLISQNVTCLFELRKHFIRKKLVFIVQIKNWNFSRALYVCACCIVVPFQKKNLFLYHHHFIIIISSSTSGVYVPLFKNKKLQ